MKRIGQVIQEGLLDHLLPPRQVQLLLEAAEETPEMGFMTRLLALCALPRTNPGSAAQWSRRNGPITLTISATGDERLPFGNYPRLVLAWVCTEAVRTQSPVLELGESLSEFMRRLGVHPSGGGPRGQRTRLRNQIQRLFSSAVRMTYVGDNEERSIGAMIASETDFWWQVDEGGQRTFWGQSRIRLSTEFFNEIVKRPMPIDLRILRALKRCSLGIDLYLWITYTTFRLREEARYPWLWLYRQFADAPVSGYNKDAVKYFRRQVLRELKKIEAAWPDFGYRIERGNRGKSGALVLGPIRPRVPPVTKGD